MKQMKRINSQSSRRHLATKRSHKKVMARSRKYYLQTEIVPVLEIAQP